MLKPILLIAACIILYAGCTDSPSSSIEQPPDPFDLSPMENEQAELMAIWVSSQIVAPLDLYNRIDSDLTLINNTWGDSIEVWDDVAEFAGSLYPGNDVSFFTPWRTGYIQFRADSITKAAILDSSYTEFYQLLDSLNYDSISTFSAPLNKPDMAIIFKGRLNSRALVNRLSQLSGLTIVSVQPLSFVGGLSMVMPYIEDTISNYFYYFGFDDCPSGCINYHIYYFGIKPNQDSAILIDIYNSETDPVLPDWGSLLTQLFQEWRDDLFTGVNQ